ncbi:G2/M phase-specific E3 ubiquitin-protein ligase [Aplochiton taeniatus]
MGKTRGLKRIRSSTGSNNEGYCALCKLSVEDPDQYGEKITLKQQKLTVHYFCLLMSSGVYQKGEEGEGIFGFLVDDIHKEIRRSSRLRCVACKQKGASVGCFVKSCRQMVHFPCGKKQKFIFQFTDLYPSYCVEHSPTQSLPVSADISLPQSCSVCLDPIEALLSYSILKCPACHTSWFHRECVQKQAHSAAMFFFRCTLCNNKDLFQQEMLRMGIHIPERDASWEMEENAYGELLQVHQHCDALKCLSHNGRSHTAKTGQVLVWFEVVRCTLCGSSGTHRKCSALSLYATNWMCEDCAMAVDGKASLVSGVSPQCKGQRRRNRLSKQSLTSCQSPKVSSQLTTSPALQPPSLEVTIDQALSTGLDLLKTAHFNPAHYLSVRFTNGRRNSSPSCLSGSVATHRFLRLLVKQIQSCEVFEGPVGSKNLALNLQALREDLYFDVGCLLAVSLVHGGPPLCFFSPALYKCLFNYPRDTPLQLKDMTNTNFTLKITRMAEAQSLEELKEAMENATEYLELAGCNRPISSLDEKDVLVEDIISFHMITRLQLPFQRLREGLKTLGVFDRVQMFPDAFHSVFCGPAEKLSAETLAMLFTVTFSEQEEKQVKETPVVTFWRHYLEECEEGRSASSLEDVLMFATYTNVVPAVGFQPHPSLSFIHPQQAPASQREGGAFPQSQPSSNHLSVPVVSDYQTFKKRMELVVCQPT